MIISFLRVIKFGLQDVVRNIWLSLATIVILILAVFSINLLLTVNFVSQASVAAVKERINVNLFLKSEAQEDKIIALKAELESFPEVGAVKYVSRAEALENFKLKQQDNPEILEALRELGKNPLTPSLVIAPKEADGYDNLIARLNKLENEIVESRNFDDHKTILNKINGFSGKINEIGLTVSLVFIAISALVVYNAVRVAIYTHRKEIGIMRLVGASNSFIKMPFFVSGFFYAFFGVLISAAIYYLFLGFLEPYLGAFFADYNINIKEYFSRYAVIIFGLEFLGACLINMVASFLAVGRYSKV